MNVPSLMVTIVRITAGVVVLSGLPNCTNSLNNKYTKIQTSECICATFCVLTSTLMKNRCDETHVLENTHTHTQNQFSGQTKLCAQCVNSDQRKVVPVIILVNGVFQIVILVQPVHNKKWIC